MTALDHAVHWINGELIGGRAQVAFGLVLVGSGILLWRFGAAPAPRALVIPLLAFGLLVIIFSVAMEVTNARRLSEFRAAYELDEGAFVAREIERVQGLLKWYVYTFPAGSILLVAGMIAFLFLSTPTTRAISLIIILFGAAILYADFFSEERAKRYMDHPVLLNKRSSS